MSRATLIFLTSLGLLIVCLYSLMSYKNHLQPFYEGASILLNMVEVVSVGEGHFMADWSDTLLNVKSRENFKVGDVVTVGGVWKNNTLEAEKIHLHEHPNLSLYMSILTLPVLIFLFQREFAFDRKEKLFKSKI